MKHTNHCYIVVYIDFVNQPFFYQHCLSTVPRSGHVLSYWPHHIMILSAHIIVWAGCSIKRAPEVWISYLSNHIFLSTLYLVFFPPHFLCIFLHKQPTITAQSQSYRLPQFRQAYHRGLFLPGMTLASLPWCDADCPLSVFLHLPVQEKVGLCANAALWCFGSACPWMFLTVLFGFFYVFWMKDNQLPFWCYCFS